MRRKIEPVGILDWYDGIVLATVRATWTEGLFLAALLCWVQSRRLRVYALLRLEPADEERLKLLGEDWDRLSSDVHRSFASKERDVPLICVDERTGDVVAEKAFPSRQIAAHVVSDVQAALEPERRTWLEAVGLAGDDDGAPP